MKNLTFCLLILALAVAGPVNSQTAGLDAPVAIGPYLNNVLPAVAPGSSTGWDTENAFPNLTFVDPLWLTPVPGTGDLLLVGKDGQIWRFANSPTVTQGQVVRALDWRTHTQTGEDMGFYHLIFHPNFGQAGQLGENYVYVSYNQKPGLAGEGIDDSYWHVSRFTWLPGSGTIDPNSEEVLINQYDPQQWHNGGAMFFDNEGFLNITCGDGEFDYWHQDQNGPINGGFFGGIFRIDVDYVEALAADPFYSKSHAIRRQPQDIPTGGLARPAGWPASSTHGYGIPETNPWLNAGGTILEEFVVHGLRSPHTAHYDPVENEIWVGDVGGGAREEIDRLKIGDNGQWPIREGVNGGAEPAGAIGDWTPPVYDYAHGGNDAYGVSGSCIIGGMRYRGAKWNALLGMDKVLFGDITQGKVWTASLNPTTGGLEQVDLLFGGIQQGGKGGIGNICTDDAGEIYFMELNGTNNPGGIIRKLVSSGVSNEPPQFLSQTGVFTDLSTLTPAPGLVPYSVASPLWSDGAEKLRWIALPNDGSHDTAEEKIVFAEKGKWTFPAGTVFVKHFEMATNANDPTQIKRLETRFLVCTAGGGKYGVTYKWNAAGTDAELLTTGLGENFDVVENGGATVSRHWDYPSRSDCLLCHNNNAGQALGVRTTQLNMPFHYDATGRTANQLTTFNSLGMFDHTLTTTELENFIESRAIDDVSAPVEHRVRSYLDSNCSHCHQPGGTIDYFDARLGTPLNQQGLVDGMIQGHFVLENGRYLKPGDTALSAVHVRMGAVGNGTAMPPLAKNKVDQKAVDLLTNYITGLNGSEFQNTGTVHARYVRLTALSEVYTNAWSAVAEFSILDDTGVPIPSGQLSIADYDSEELIGENAPATNAIDGDIGTYWHTQWQNGSPQPPHHLTVDLGSPRPIGGYVYTPRQGNNNGRIAGYQVHYSNDGTNWTLMTSGTWPNDPDAKTYDSLVGLRKARCSIAGPAGTLNGDFDVTIAFDTEVTDFTASDVQVSGGSVTHFRGSGYYYVATISPGQPLVSVSVPADAANTAQVGSFASPTLVFGQDTVGPVASFTGTPVGSVSGPFALGIRFDEIPTGFSISSLSSVSAGLSNLTGSGTSYSVIVSPTAAVFSITVHPAGITDGLGNPMENPATTVLHAAAPQLFAEAESGTLAGGMTVVSDPGASGGSYVWLPDGGFPGNEQGFNAAHSATYSFTVPRAGNWIPEGLTRSSSTASDSFWIKVDGGAPTRWDTNPGSVGSGTFVWNQVGSSGSAAANLINATTNNGSFETLGGVISNAKATNWDTDPDGDVDHWNNWGASTGGPSTAQTDSGTEPHISVATQGNRIAFLQAGNAAYNLTSHAIEAGEVFTYSWDWVLAGRPNATAQLGYWNGSAIVAISGTDTTNPNTTVRHLGLGTTWTVPPGHPAIGHPIAMTVRATNGYPEIDNFVLSVTATPAVPVTLNLAAGTHTVTVYGREDGTRLDALRLTSERPLVALNAPPVSVGGGEIPVAVTFSKPVTGLTPADFTLSGATVASLTVSGDSYTLMLSPVAPSISLALPDSAASDGNGGGNYPSDVALITVRTTFEQWAIDNGLGDVGFSDDPNHNGITTLVEFLLNLDPNSHSASVFDPAVGPSGLPKTSLGAGSLLTIEFPRDSAAVAAGYRYVAQFSSDLIDWVGTENGTAIPMGGGWEHVTITDPGPGNHRFVRLELVSP